MNLDAPVVSEVEASTHERGQLRLTLVVCVWAGLILLGMLVLWSYAATAGAAGAPPLRWPARSAIARGPGASLVLFAHPLCPCTRSTLAELERLLARSPGEISANVVFIAPPGTDSSWRDSDLVRMASRIPGVNVIVDHDRRETRLFHARTSGCCLLYGPDGSLLFQGGLTSARGHEGDNDGSIAILALMAHDRTSINKTPVFGCSLFEPDDDGRCSVDPKSDVEKWTPR